MDVLLQELGDDFVLGYELLELAILKRRAGTFRRSLEGSCAIFKELPLPQIKLGGLDAMPVADSPPAYKFAFQPGQVGYNPNANLQLWAPSDAGYNANNLYRNSLSRYFLPSVDEWYKAAYFNPISGIYFDYPTSSNSVPDGIDFVGDPVFDAVFAQGASNAEPNVVTDVGLLSPYGTAGQGGNIMEWNETDFDLVNDASPDRIIRGGAWGSISSDLSAPSGFGATATTEATGWGFRVASAFVPEPSTAVLASVIFALLVSRRGRRG